MIYEFKVTLKGSKPSIWRRIQLPKNSNFHQLHKAINNAMGWKDYHLHHFFIIDPRIGAKVEIGQKTEEDDEDMIDGAGAKIADYFVAPKDKALYEYDFGDSWEHQVVLEKILPIDPNATYPLCTGGKCACPPEDCGGIYGYEELLEKIRDPAHAENKEMLDWLTGCGYTDFDPSKFDPTSVMFGG